MADRLDRGTIASFHKAKLKKTKTERETMEQEKLSESS
ncbi:thymosin beta-10-like [Castor canadensis]|uniref:Thymosin beta-10-like n=1 Tax=Castor canadensis TaxID=51338 RepID=A0AC58ME49_CASCN